ncbi:MAG: hypothetical protein QOD56_2188 [Gammaproteobacteria bacterium]|nr:hypothetical protein [Gammaproteobacteria bacterium]
MKHDNNVPGGRAVGLRRTKYTVTVVSLLAACAALGNDPAAAAPALLLKPLDLRPPELQSILSADSPQTITPTDAEDTPAFVIVGAPVMLDMRSDTHVPQTGFGALYWALRTPTQAWRIFFPEP